MLKTIFDGEKITLVRDATIPEVTHNDDILIRVKVASLCGTDLHILSGGIPLKKVPLTLGHEYAGIVEAVGKGVKHFRPGERVFGSPFIPCGSCYYCKMGKPQLCENRLNVGISIDGSFAEYLLLPHGENCLHHLPDSLSFEIGAIMGDMVSTSAYAVKRGMVQGGDTVVILGLGPIGLSAVLFARAWGAKTIIGVTRSEHKRIFAEKIGADYTLDPREVDVISFVLSHTNGHGADVVIETAAVQETLNQALEVVRKAGRVSTIGVFEKEMVINMKRLVLHELELVGSLDPVDDEWIEQMIRIITKNRIDFTSFITHRFGLEAINEAFDVFKNKRENCIKVAIVLP